MKKFPDKKNTRLIIDTDPGVDDAIALFVVLACPWIDIRLISTSYGNSDVHKTTENLFRVLSVYSHMYPDPIRKLLISKGAEKPIRREYQPYFKIHGMDALGDSELPYEVFPISIKSAEDEIYAEVAKHKNEISILCLGPLTNIAKFAMKYPEACALVKEILIMGGAFNYPGNYNPMVEANFGWDPEAVNLVKKAGFRKITIVPLNVTEPFQLTGSDLNNIKSLNFRNILIKVLKKYIEYYKTLKAKSFDGGVIHDAVALFCLLQRKDIKTRKFDFSIKRIGKLAGHVRANYNEKYEKSDINVVSRINYQKLRIFIFDKLNEYA